jgi:hypothetical protein
MCFTQADVLLSTWLTSWLYNLLLTQVEQMGRLNKIWYQRGDDNMVT